MPGVKAAILTGGENRTVRYYGQELAAVAATTKQQCLDALRAIKVEATPLPFVVNEDDAVKPMARRRSFRRLEHQSSAQRYPWRCRCGPRGRRCHGRGRTEHAGAAPSSAGDARQHRFRRGRPGLTAWASTQGIFSVRDELADHMHFPRSQRARDLRVHGRRLRREVRARRAWRARRAALAGGGRAGEAHAPAARRGPRGGQPALVAPADQARARMQSGKLVAADCENKGSPGIGGGGTHRGRRRRREHRHSLSLQFSHEAREPVWRRAEHRVLQRVSGARSSARPASAPSRSWTTWR